MVGNTWNVQHNHILATYTYKREFSYLAINNMFVSLNYYRIVRGKLFNTKWNVVHTK